MPLCVSMCVVYRCAACAAIWVSFSLSSLFFSQANLLSGGHGSCEEKKADVPRRVMTPEWTRYTSDYPSLKWRKDGRSSNYWRYMAATRWHVHRMRSIIFWRECDDGSKQFVLPAYWLGVTRREGDSKNREWKHFMERCYVYTLMTHFLFWTNCFSVVLKNIGTASNFFFFPQNYLEKCALKLWLFLWWGGGKM